MEISKELEEDLKQVAQVIYCHYGEKKTIEEIVIFKNLFKSKEGRKMFKIISDEMKAVDKRLEEVYKEWDEVFGN